MIRDYVLSLLIPTGQQSLNDFTVWQQLRWTIERHIGGSVRTIELIGAVERWSFDCYWDAEDVRNILSEVLPSSSKFLLECNNRVMFQGITEAEHAQFRAEYRRLA